MQQAVIFGASGYAGLELLRLLAWHPEVRVRAASSNRWAGQPVRDHARGWQGTLTFQAHDDVMAEAEAGQVALLATPAITSAELAPKLLAKGLKVIDLSGAFRLRDPAAYPEWYGFEHPAPDLLAQAHYGLPEFFEMPQGTTLVANPGCYATACALAIQPLLKQGLLVSGAPLIADGKSGVTGAGRAMHDALLFSEVNENLRPYKVGGHQHVPEVEQTLQDSSGTAVRLSFTAHLIPMRRGLLASVYAPVNPGVGQDDVQAAYVDLAQSDFIRWVDRPPETARVKHDNFAEVGAHFDSRTQTVAAFCAIDNLVKGAAGQAVQNLNVLSGLPQTLGLLADGPQDRP